MEVDKCWLLQLSDEVLAKCFAHTLRIKYLLTVNKELRRRLRAMLEYKGFPVSYRVRYVTSAHGSGDEPLQPEDLLTVLAGKVSKIKWTLDSKTVPHNLLSRMVELGAGKMARWTFDWKAGREAGKRAIRFMRDAGKYTHGLKKLSIPLQSGVTAKEINAGLKNCAPSLSTLSMHNITFAKGESFRGCEQVFGEMEKLRKLKVTCYSDNTSLDARHWQSFAGVLQKLSGLEVLQIDRVYLDGAANNSMAEAMSALTELKELNLWLAGVGSPLMSRMASIFNKLGNLQVLRLDNNMITSVGATALATAFIHLPKLRVLVLSSNPLADPGCEAIGNALHNLVELETLNLYDVSMGANGAMAVGKGLGKLRKITNLNLYNAQGIPADGFYTIAEALSQLPELRELNLRRCNLRGEGAQQVAQSLHSATRLEELALTGNHNLRDEGAKHVAEAVKYMTSLRKLYMVDCGISETGKAQIKTACSRCTGEECIRNRLNYHMFVFGEKLQIYI